MAATAYSPSALGYSTITTSLAVPHYILTNIPDVENNIYDQHQVPVYPDYEYFVDKISNKDVKSQITSGQTEGT